MSEPRRVPIHRALASPPMLLGCERTSLLLLLTAAGALLATGLHGMNKSVLMYAVLLIAGGVPFLVHVAKVDPQFREVYSRSRDYRTHYCATGRWDVVPRSPRKW